MAMDVAGVRYADWSVLLRYCYRVAGTVGLMMCHVMGVDDDEALAHAAHLGIAMQLTNVARDVREDWERGRLYLPDDLACGAGAADLGHALGGALPASARAAVARATAAVLERADAYYRSGDAGLRHLSPRCAFAVRTARLVYSRIGERVRAQGCDPLAGRAVVSGGRKAAAAARARARAPVGPPGAVPGGRPHSDGPRRRPGAALARSAHPGAVRTQAETLWLPHAGGATRIDAPVRAHRRRRRHRGRRRGDGALRARRRRSRSSRRRTPSADARRASRRRSPPASASRWSAASTPSSASTTTCARCCGASIPRSRCSRRSTTTRSSIPRRLVQSFAGCRAASLADRRARCAARPTCASATSRAPTAGAALEMLRFDDASGPTQRFDARHRRRLPRLARSSRHARAGCSSTSSRTPASTPRRRCRRPSCSMMFHFYFTGNPEGLVFDVGGGRCPRPSGSRSAPGSRRAGVTVRTGSAVRGVERDAERRLGASSTTAGAPRRDSLVLALDVTALKAARRGEPRARRPAARERRLACASRVPSRSGGCGSIARWRRAAPASRARPASGLLDNISSTIASRTRAAPGRRAHGGAVVELHAYALPAELSTRTPSGADLLAGLHALYPGDARGAGPRRALPAAPATAPPSRRARTRSGPRSRRRLRTSRLAGDFVRSRFRARSWSAPPPPASSPPARCSLRWACGRSRSGRCPARAPRRRRP